MDRILAGLDFVFVYLDDVIIGSRSMSKHLQHVQTLFQRLQAAGLVIIREKCMFGVPEVDFSGHHVSAADVSPISSRVTVINDHPRPTTVKELQGFLGVINFYRRFIPAADHILKPLTDQLKGGPKPAASILWTEAMPAERGQGRPRRLCQADLLPPWSGDFSSGGRLSGPHRSRPTAEGASGGSMETSRIFLQEA
jgi:hypothetical protein